VRLKTGEIALLWSEERFAELLANALCRMDEIEGRLWVDIMRLAMKKVKTQAAKELSSG
jgi:hypothetical protein